MKVIIAFFACTSLMLSSTALARNTPCSGKKGGVSHCQGTKFVCKDGSISKSKKSCNRE